MEIELALLLITLFLLTAGSAFFSSSEVALFSLSPMKIKSFRNSSDNAERLIGELLSKPRDLLVTVFILNTIVNILLQNVASDMFGRFAGWGLKVGVPLTITLIFGEIIPKNFGLQHNVWLSKRVARVINFFQKVMSPLRKMVIAVTTPISKICFFYLRKAEPISKEELKHTLDTSEAHGVLNREESEFVKGYINLHEAKVKEVMRQKDELLYFDTADPLSKLLHLFVDQRCSRIPVCEGNLDQILGVITAKQYFNYSEKINSVDDLKHYLLKPFYVPENIPAKILLNRFTDDNEHFALVVDEYGSISGLITVEDICELVVGDIQDLRDSKLSYTRAGSNEIIAGGRLELIDFAEIFGDALPNNNNLVTVGGWLTEQFGEVPKSGAKLEAYGYLFQVLAAEQKRIRRIYIRKLRNSSENPST